MQTMQKSILALIAGFAVIGLLFVESTLTGLASAQVTRTNTVLIPTIGINEVIAKNRGVVTSETLPSLGTGYILNRRGTTRYQTILRLARDFTGGRLVYERNDQGKTQDFIKYEYNEPLYEVEIFFQKGLKSKINNDSSLSDIEDIDMNLLGSTAVFGGGEIDTTRERMELHIFTDAGELVIDDNYTDSEFTTTVTVNGIRIPAEALIHAQIIGKDVILHSIIYRPLAVSKTNTHVYQPLQMGLRNRLKYPGATLSRTFDLLYSGIQPATSEPPRQNGGIIFEPNGNQAYTLLFTNNQGRNYRVPYFSLQSGVILSGKDDNRFITTEGNSETDYIINENDYFLTTSSTNTGGISTILRLDKVDAESVIVQDLAEGQKTIKLVNAIGTLVASGTGYKLYADTANKKIVVDQNNDGTINGGISRIIAKGGIQIIPGTTTTIRVPAKLFKENAQDESTTINFEVSGSRIDATVPTQGNLSLHDDRTGTSSGMTLFGLLFTRSGRNEPHLVSIGNPVSQRSSGQRNGFILLTTERARWVKQ